MQINYFRCYLIFLFHSCSKEARSQFEVNVLQTINGKLLWLCIHSNQHVQMNDLIYLEKCLIFCSE